MKKLARAKPKIKSMSGVIIKTERSITYRITNPEWVCQWCIYKMDKDPIKRCLYLHTLDPLEDSEAFLKIIPGLLREIQNVVDNWILEGDEYASLLLLQENKPALLEYAQHLMA